MKAYLKPEFEILNFGCDDVVTVSTPGDESYDNVGNDKNWNFIGEKDEN